MTEFPHLPLPKKTTGLYNAPRAGGKIESPITAQNLKNRKQHGRKLKSKVDDVLSDWESKQINRFEEGLPLLPNQNVTPIFLQIDTKLFNADSLASFGIEVIAEEEDGFIIGASTDNFRSLKEKIDSFLKENGKFKNTASKLWNIIAGEQWRLEHILSEELLSKWQTIKDDVENVVDVSIACIIKIPGPPAKKNFESNASFQKKYQSWQIRKDQIERNRLDLEEQRQNEFANFIAELGGANN